LETSGFVLRCDSAAVQCGKALPFRIASVNTLEAVPPRGRRRSL